MLDRTLSIPPSFDAAGTDFDADGAEAVELPVRDPAPLEPLGARDVLPDVLGPPVFVAEPEEGCGGAPKLL